MKSIFKLLVVFFFITSCGSKKPKILSTTANSVKSTANYAPFLNVTEYSSDKEYGLTGDKPVKVGEKSAENQKRYLASLAGPNGEVLQFHRRGACCPYESENSTFGQALVDVYEVSYEGLKKPILVYISFYDFETLYIPKGFTKRL